MTAFVISRMTVKDPAKLAEYGAAAGPIAAQFGGKIVLRGKFHSALVGEGGEHATGVLEFPDTEAVSHCFSSPQYQALVALRDEACDMQLTVYEA